jgi:D-aminoacyl-tRNA deacylase
MRAVIQRVSKAEVRIDGKAVARIGPGLVVLVAVGVKDTAESAKALAEKVMNLRILADEQGRMNCSILDAGGGVLCVSQFTLYGDVRRGRRPSYIEAAPPETAQPLYEHFLQALRALASPRGVSVESGRFQAMMQVELVNDGPVTILLDTDKAF